MATVQPGCLDYGLLIAAIKAGKSRQKSGIKLQLEQRLVNAMHLWGEPELLTDVIMHCDAFITGENELLV